MITVVGRRDTGKTSFCVAIAEIRQHYLGGQIYFPGYPSEFAPPHITAVPLENVLAVLQKIPPGSQVILDDMGRIFNSKRTMTDKGLAYEGAINELAHHDVMVHNSAQDSSDIHKASLRANVLALKPPEMMFSGSERQAMRSIVDRAAAAFKQLSEKDILSHIYLWRDPERNGLIRYNRPTWMDRQKAKYLGHNPRGREQQGRIGGQRQLAAGRAGPARRGAVVTQGDELAQLERWL